MDERADYPVWLTLAYWRRDSYASDNPFYLAAIDTLFVGHPHLHTRIAMRIPPTLGKRFLPALSDSPLASKCPLFIPFLSDQWEIPWSHLLVEQHVVNFLKLFNSQLGNLVSKIWTLLKSKQSHCVWRDSSSWTNTENLCRPTDWEKFCLKIVTFKNSALHLTQTEKSNIFVFRFYVPYELIIPFMIKISGK